MALEYIPTVQHDDTIWRVVSKGNEKDGKTFCHLAAIHQFQKDGKTPVQISDWVPTAKLHRAGIR